MGITMPRLLSTTKAAICWWQQTKGCVCANLRNAWDLFRAFVTWRGARKRSATGWGRILLLAFAANDFGIQAAAQTRGEEIPLFAGLEADVNFWVGIFSRFKPHQCVFHHRDDLGVIYGIANLKGTPRQQSRMAERQIKVIRAAFARLARGESADGRLEQLLVAATPKEWRQVAGYRDAMEAVRCQRGVDLKNSMARAQTLMPMVRRVLAQKRLPDDLAYLPHLESGYHTEAKSHAGARGLWQLMPATARSFGLTVSPRRDARINPYQSTVAAANFLRELREKTGSWALAITAYNYGQNGIMRAIKVYGPDYMTIRSQHRTRLFGFAARNYYPSFLALRQVAQRHGQNVAAGVLTTRRLAVAEEPRAPSPGL